jgi:hypothetical protein
MGDEQVTVGAKSVSPVLGVLDVLVRAFKTALEVFLVSVPADGLFSLDIGAAKLALVAGLSAGASIIVNAVLSWTRTGR